MALTVICAGNQAIVFHEDDIGIDSTRIRVNLFYFSASQKYCIFHILFVVSRGNIGKILPHKPTQPINGVTCHAIVFSIYK